MLYLAGKRAERSKNPLAHQTVLWIFALGLSFLVSVLAIFRGGYIGPDYNFHLARLLDTRTIFDFSLTNPPLYSLLGHGLFLLIGRNNGFPITLSVIQVAINLVALWWFFHYTECRFRSPVLHFAFVLFLTFLPVRIIHAAIIGEDTTTVPLFVLLLFLFANFLVVQTSTPKNAVFLGLGLSVAVWTKYSFAALIPVIFVILAFMSWRRAWKLNQFATICALSLALPSAVVLCTYRTAQHWPSTSGHGTVAREVWLPKGAPRSAAEMDYKDLFSIKVNDAALFRAPEFFRPSDSHPFGYRQPHKHSYLALSHMGVFTDTMNLFQDLPIRQNIDAYLIPDFKTRRLWKTPLMVTSMSLGIIWTLLALIGTPYVLFAALKNLWINRLEREHAAVLLAIAYFLLMVLPIPFVHSGVLNGFWTPRLILPSLLCFFWAAFLLLDQKIVRKSQKIAYVVLGLVIMQCTLEIMTLVPVGVAGKVTAFEGGHGNGKGQFDSPRGIATDSAGNIFVADTGNWLIQKFSPNGTFVTSIAITDPNGIAIDHAGNIYVTEIGSKHRVQKLGPDGKLIAEWAPGLYGPRKIAIGPDDSIYVVDSGRNRIVKFSPDGQVLASWGSGGSGNGQFIGLTSVAVDLTTNKVYVADPINKRIQVFDSAGRFLTKWPVPEWGQPDSFEDLAIDADRNRLYASSANMNTILVFDLQGNRTGTLTPSPPDKLNNPTGLALAKDKLLVLDSGSARVSVIDLQNR